MRHEYYSMSLKCSNAMIVINFITQTTIAPIFFLPPQLNPIPSCQIFTMHRSDIFIESWIRIQHVNSNMVHEGDGVWRRW